MYREISSCRICGNTDLDFIVSLGVQSLTGVFPKRREDPVLAAPLELVKCRKAAGDETCGLVQLKHSCDAAAMYGTTYGYRSGLNQSMVQHLWARARGIKEFVPLAPGDLLLDIGSNDSTLLQALDGPGLQLVGMDPTGVKFQRFYPPHIQLIPDFFSAERFAREQSGKKAKVITSIAMFYDLDSPLDFMRQVGEVLDDEGIWVFEQSYLPTMLAQNAYDTICHEHLEYYALSQIMWMAKRAGLRVLEVERNAVNGGSFCVIAAKEGAGYRPNHRAIAALLQEEQAFGLDECGVYQRIRERIFRHRGELLRVLAEAETRGDGMLGYGASTKGNVILQFCGITPRQLPFIAEVNPDKFGSFTPGTLIPIISEEQAHAMRPGSFLVLPWHFRDNLIAREREFLAGGGRLIFPLPEIEVVAR
jgi:hypothetical protein